MTETRVERKCSRFPLAFVANRGALSAEQAMICNIFLISSNYSFREEREIYKICNYALSRSPELFFRS